MTKSIIAGSFTLALGLMFTALPARAESSNADEFAKHKTEMMQDADERIAKINEFKSCLSSASTPDAAKPCREKMKQFREAHRAEVQARNKTRIDERIKKLEAKKAELNQAKK